VKVLLTGASGFVGSHIVESLRARAIATAALLRPASDKRFIQPHLSYLDVCQGSLEEPASIDRALQGVTHVIHCAGCVKARDPSEFCRVNQQGTRRLVEAVNRTRGAVQRIVHISSMAASGPATAAKPACETDTPQPVSEYGRSKLAAEDEVRQHCQVPCTILRPPGVYGPRDHGFLPMFRAVNRHLLLRPTAQQLLSLVFVKDLAEAALVCLQHPTSAGQTYFAASPEPVTAATMAAEIATQSGRWVVPLPVPTAIVWLMCLGQEVFSRITGRAMLLNLAKFAELRAPGWVCDPSRLERDVGYRCSTSLREGISTTLKWYGEHGWL
jgi:dihydroflavonol-4-reductase